MNFSIVSDKKTGYSIVIPAAFSAVEKVAAEELQQYLKQALSVELPICKEGEETGKAFYIGYTDFAKANGLSGKSRENWLMKAVDENIVLTGGETNKDRGIFYSVSHFLEDVVGVRWWTRFEENVPSLSELSLASDFYKEGTPYFHFRKILTHKNIPDFKFEARNRGNIVMYDDHLPDDFLNEDLQALGGAMYMGRPNHVHSLGLYFPADEYFEKHPDWFAWSDFEQKRVTYGHYCLTNEYIQAMIDKLLGFVREDQALWNEKGIEPPVFYSVSFPDTANGFCQCEKCKEAMAKKGPSGYAIDFVNKLARAVAKEYPDVKLETLVYSVYLDKPLDDTLPEKNLIIRLAQVFVDLIHGVHEKGNAWYLQLLQDWSEICKKSGSDLYIWDYMYQLFFDIPGPVARRAGDTWRAFAEYGVKGVFVEDQCYSADFWELSVYVLLHLNEDPYADVDALIADFMQGYYGPAAPYVKAYYDELDRAATENPYSIFCVIESAHFNYLDVKTFKNGIPLLDKALEAVKDDEVLTGRVRYLKTLLAASLAIKYYDLKNRAKELDESFDFDRKEMCEIAIEGYKDILMNRPKPRQDLDERFERHIKYFENLSLEEDVASLPVELSHVDPEDAYQFFFKNTCRHLSLNALYGFSVVDDPESATGKTGKFCKDDTLVDAEIICLATCPKDAVGAKGVSIAIVQDGKTLSSIELFKEDIVPDKFHLYKVGSVSGIRASGDTRVDMFGGNFEWLSLTGISVLFPMDACEIYLSMKFAGEMYGGSKDEQEAVYLDRAIVVRTEK